MKTRIRPLACTAALLGLGALTPSAAAATAPKPPATHLLYLGSDVSVDWKGRLCPVLDVRGSSFVIAVDGKLTSVPSVDSNLRLKIDDTLKLATAPATVSGLKAERDYTPENDPRLKYERMASYSMGATGVSDLAAKDMRFATASAGLAKGTDGAALAEARASSAETTYQQSLDQGLSSINDLGLHTSRMERELMEKRFDALRVTFELSSPQPLGDPYLVVLARYRENPAEPNKARLLVYAKTLPPIDATPQKVELLRGGLPPGYELEDCQVHLYNRGREIATTVSRKQVPLTRTEAFQYSLVDYTIQRKDRTLPPVPAREFWPADLPARMSAPNRDLLLYVKVDQGGNPAGVFEDEACQRPVADTVLAGMIGEMRFFPALTKGKPVAGVAAMHVGK